MASHLMQSLVTAGIGMYVESKMSPTIFAPPPEGQIISPLFFATPAILLGVGFFTLVHGTKVGSARRKYMELAKKDGEANAEERYSYPNLYVDGNTKHARAFNAVQRSHQHILETFPSAILGGCLGATQFPLCAACATLTYAIGRIVFSTSYANSEGDATKRYSSPLAKYQWLGLLGNFILGFAAAVKILMTVKLA